MFSLARTGDIRKLLVMFLGGFILVAATSVAPAQANSLYPPSNEVIPDVSSLPRSSGYDLIHPDEIHPRFNDPDLVRPYRYSLRMDHHRGILCYTMRSYFVARQEPHSDVTWPVGSLTCQRASKFAVKDAAKP